MTEPFTDWPHVETDMAAWREWAEAPAGPCDCALCRCTRTPSIPFKLRKRPFLVRLFNHYRSYRQLGLAVGSALYWAWDIARL